VTGATPTSSVHHIRELPDGTFVVRFDRHGMPFSPGQHLTLGTLDDAEVREYSIYSRPDDPFLEVLVKEIDDGSVSRHLHRLKPGDPVRVAGPFGFFGLDDADAGAPHLFVATGTGIAPFRCMAAARPPVDYHILHGVRFAREAYDRDDYPRDRYTLCTSRDTDGDYHGRVTDYLAATPPRPGTRVYLCGNCAMIYAVYDLLGTLGFDPDHIRTEVYF